MTAKTDPNQVEIIKHETAYCGYFRIDAYKLRHTLFTGGWSSDLSREVFERGHAAGVLGYDPDQKKFVLCEQFRIGAYVAEENPWQLELVAGVIEDGEAPEQVVCREAKEEIGQPVTDLWPIQKYLVSPGGSSECVHLFLGRVSSADADGVFGAENEGEDIRVRVIEESHLMDMMENGEITNAMTLIAAQWFFMNRDRIGKEWK